MSLKANSVYEEITVKKNIFLIASNDYLFFTTGVYMLPELLEEFNLILFLNDRLKGDNRIKKLNNCYDFSIIYIPVRGKWLAPHLSLYKIFLESLIKYKPKVILQNNFKNIENMYLFYLSRKVLKKCLNIVYLNGQQRLRSEITLVKSQRKKNAIDLSARKNIFFGWRMVFIFLLIRGSINKYIHYYLMPLLITRRFPYSFSHNHNFHKKKQDHIFDVFLVYKRKEESLLASSIDYNGAIARVVPSQVRYGDECNKILYPDTIQTKNVLIAPSLIGFRRLKNEKYELDLWISAIKLLELKFQGYSFIFKLHPSVRNNKYYDEIIDYISNKNPNLLIYSPEKSAENFIIASEVVVSDVSSVLWWTSYYKKKLAISFDFNNCIGSNDMLNVENVFYFNNLKAFSIFEPSVVKTQYDEEYKNIKSLADYCLDEIKRKNYD